jgi:hypothetical protein
MTLLHLLLAIGALQLAYFAFLCWQVDDEE